MKGKDSLILGAPIHQLGDQPGQKGSFRGSEESGEDTLRQAEQRPKTQMIWATSLHSPACDIYLMVHAGAGC